MVINLNACLRLFFKIGYNLTVNSDTDSENVNSDGISVEIRKFFVYQTGNNYVEMLRFLIIFCALILLIKSETCDEGIEHHFGTKSAYRYVANKNYVRKENSEECARKIWMFVRHGTRYPSIDQILIMKNDLTVLRDFILKDNSEGDTNLVKSDLNLFENWRPIVEEHEAKKLTVEGEKEMLELAERMQARFPRLLSPIYSNTSYVFKFTKTQRTKKSAQYFSAGLFGRQAVRDVYYPQALKKDPILRFYKLCDKWRSSIKKNITTYTEKQRFENSEIVKATVAKIRSKLGLKHELTFGDVQSMYTACAFETAWAKNKKSPWCIPFDLESVKVLEYSEDLKYYWVDGYGYELTYQQACPAMQDMLKFIEDADKYPNAIFYFTHSGAMLKLLCHLGIHKDKNHLRASDFSLNFNRRWRVSKIDPFANNIAFILFECNNSRKLLTLHNEKPVRLPPCPNEDLCDIEVIREYYNSSILNCDFHQMCKK